MASRKRAIQSNEHDIDEPCEKQKQKKVTEADTLKSTKEDCITTFTEVAKLGNGTYGNVHIWFNYDTSKIYAGKTFKSKDDFRKEYEQVSKLNHDYNREKENDSKLKHTNVLTAVQILENKNVILYNLYSYNLEELLLNRTENILGLSEELILILIKDMTNALKYIIQDVNIVHRDVKPSNILFDEKTRRFILADFGCAVSFDRYTKRFEEVIAGTRSYLNPSLLQQLNNGISEKVNTSIDTELWSVAVTFYQATTGIHPFYHNNLQNWQEKVIHKPEDCFWMDAEGEYKHQFEGYNRVSNQCKFNVLQNLYLKMMSTNASFQEYFDLTEQQSLTQDMVYLLDLNSFHMHINRYSLTETTIETVLKDHFPSQTVVISQSGKLIKSHKRFLPVTNKKSPILLYSFVNKRPDLFKNNLKVRLFQSTLNYFVYESADSMTKPKVKCVLRNTLNVIENCSENIQLSKEHILMYGNHVKKFQAELATKFKFFQVQITQLFTYHTPKNDFKKIVVDVSNLVKDALQVSLDDILSWVQDYNEIEENENVSSFKQHITLLEQSKLSSCNTDHVNQIKISMISAMESVLDSIELYFFEYNKSFLELKTQLASIESLSCKIEFAIIEANKIIAQEIEQHKDKH